MKTVDLHTHSSESDGTLSPAQVVILAYQSGLSAVALTDHDTADGLVEAADTACQLAISSNGALDFEFIPGIELSVSFMGRELHIVGLHLDIHTPAFLEALDILKENRVRRNQRMIEKIRAAGIDITMEKLLKDQGGGVLTRANFASYLLKRGCIQTVQEGFDKYLSPGKPFYVPREYLNPREAIDLIHSVRGLAILAHPLLYHFKQEELERAVKDLAALKLDGLEAYYSLNKGYDTVHMKSLAKRHGLVLSGGSDFHGGNKPHIKLGRGLGRLYVPADVLQEQKDYLKSRYGT